MPVVSSETNRAAATRSAAVAATGLGYGARGTAVRTLQAQLSDRGHVTEIDGKFGRFAAE